MTDEEFDSILTQRREEHVLIEASNHPESCRCPICQEWWALMGPEDPDDPSFGPFTVAEMELYRLDRKPSVLAEVKDLMDMVDASLSGACMALYPQPMGAMALRRHGDDG